MTLTNIGRNGRVYTRRFDHDHARRLYAAGIGISEIARRMGVTDNAVRLVVVPLARAHQRNYLDEHIHTVCERCGARCLVADHPRRRTKIARCHRCANKNLRERFRFDTGGVLVAVRCTSRDCANGERWQHPDEFPRGTRYHDVRPGGIHGSCRQCQTRARQQHRLRHRIPCTRCGKPRLPDSEKGSTKRGVTDTGLCRTCYTDTRLKGRTGVIRSPS